VNWKHDEISQNNRLTIGYNRGTMVVRITVDLIVFPIRERYQMSEYKLGWKLFCDGGEFDQCTSEDMRRGWAAAFTQSETGVL